MTSEDTAGPALRQEVGTTVLVALGAYMLWVLGQYTFLYIIGFVFWLIAAVLTLVGALKVMSALSLFWQLRRAGRMPAPSLLVPLLVAAVVLAVVVQQSVAFIAAA